MPKRTYDRTEDYEPKDTDKLDDFIDTKSDSYLWPENPSVILLKFKDRINWVYKAGHDRGLCDGEITQMINLNFGYYPRFENIPWGKMPEVREWLINNAHRNFQMLSPNYHNELMKSENLYSQWFKKLDRKPEPQTSW